MRIVTVQDKVFCEGLQEVSKKDGDVWARSLVRIVSSPFIQSWLDPCESASLYMCDQTTLCVQEATSAEFVATETGLVS